MRMEENLKNLYFQARLRLTVIGKAKPVSLRPLNTIPAILTFQSNISRF